MITRHLLAAVLALAGCPAAAAGSELLIVLQRSPLAGFRHYDGRQAWPALREGDRLELVREPRNPHDANAVRVRWRGRTLGYVPRGVNAAIARHLDRGTRLEGRIAAKSKHRNGAARIEFDIVAPLQEN